MMFTVVDSSSKSSHSKSRWKWWLLDLPLWATLWVASTTYALKVFYHGPMQTLIESYRRSEHNDKDQYGYYTDFFPDVTYYARSCDDRDVTTHDSNDIVVPPNVTMEQAADTMMTHGALLFQELLTPQTAQQLRDYLETRNQIQDQLSWFEKFWGDIGRLSLGLGVDDAPIIAQALHEVGHHQALHTALEAIVGPDPAIVEISTLTTMHGAQPQGIHTDSDYFGSSLLYSRTFLHSYTLFMALQDTTPKMGATTICPGTHWCADEDLSHVCGHAPNAFEVSSNGLTGRDVGLLYAGDGMMFNQNIWHRGPKNNDPERPINRVMFILTFVSRLEMDKADVRQQGVGTYYYQRWNMWGHTWNDLKRASTVMTQPLGALRALGVWKWPLTSRWGVVWLEHFARQMANNEDFFTTDELSGFLHILDSVPLLRWLTTQITDQLNDNDDDDELLWEPFLKQLIDQMSQSAWDLHGAVLAVYMTMSVVGIAFFTPKGNRGQSFRTLVKHTAFKYMGTFLILGGIWYHVNYQSYLSKRIHMRDVWKQPFPEVDDTYELHRTTFPERDDILVGSRFDAPYLASFDKVLEYHPGNQMLRRAMIEDGMKMPSLLQAYIQPGRFLQQDYKTGYWILMTREETLTYLARQVYAHHHPLTARLDQHLKQVLSDARFGWQRNTVMAQRFTSAMCTHWQSILYSSLDNQPEAGWMKLRVTTASATERQRTRPSSSFSPNHALVMPLPTMMGGSLTVRRTPSNVPSRFKKDVQRIPFMQGDLVQVYHDPRYDDWVPAEILLINPFERATVQYIDTDDIAIVHLEALQHATGDDENYESPLLPIGTRVMARFKGKDFFAGRIDGIQEDDTYAVQFDDGDYDESVPMNNIRTLRVGNI